jgi:hypothetical protein
MHYIIYGIKYSAMNATIEKGDLVLWEWGKVTAKGRVIDLYQPISCEDLEKLALTIEISKTAKALLIQMADGRKVIKMENEVTKKK